MTKLLVCVLLGLAGLAACAESTTIEQQWKSPTASRQPMQRVIALYASHQGATVRRGAEDALVHQLAAVGVQATPAYAVLSDADLTAPELTIDKLRAEGYDGVVVMRLIGAHQQVYSTPPTFYGYWGTGWGTVQTETIVRVETNAYSLHTGKLEWSGLSRTVDPSGVHDLIGSVTTTVAQTLAKEGVVA
jgi:hypothetical protein